MTPRDVVLAFWEAMGSNDFHAASQWLSADFVLEWPQSREVIQGRKSFAEINTAYPANGLWRFEVHRLLADGPEVVTEVGVTDGTITATVVTFHTVQDGKIARQWEYWPDPYDPPAWRAAWVSLR